MDSEIYIAKTSVLTPHKISLLVLLSIYFETAIEDDLLETLLFFLIEKISNEHRFPEPTLQEFCDEIHQRTCPLSKVCTEIQRECESSLERALLTHLKSMDSPHDLIELIKDSKKLTTNEESDSTPIPLGKYSILGIFVRRCYIESERLLFDDISRLYNAFVKYKTDKTVLFSKKGKENMDLCYKSGEFSSVLSEVTHRYHMCKQDLIAKCDAESFSHYIITQLRKYGGILPPELESKLRVIHKRMPEISTIYYIDYVNWRADEFLQIFKFLPRRRRKPVDATDQQMLDSLISKAKQSNFIYLQSLGELGNSQRQIQQVIDHSDTSPEDLVTAYCQMADLHVSYGNYEQALKLLEESKEKFLGIRRAALQWVVCLEKVLYQKCFARDERASIEALEVQLRGSCQDDEVLQDDFNYNRALYLARIDRPDEAMDLLHELIQKSSRLGSQNQMLVANYYLKLAEIRIETEDPTSALPYVLSALCISERFHHQTQREQSIPWDDVLIPLRRAQA
ncbi:16817_t:CDS:2, partial [Racocetra fulgida]